MEDSTSPLIENVNFITRSGRKKLYSTSSAIDQGNTISRIFFSWAYPVVKV